MHALVAPVIDALEALGNWEPPDEQGALIAELETLLPGVELLLQTFAGQTLRLAHTMEDYTPVSNEVIRALIDASESSKEASDDVSAVIAWQNADAADIDRANNPRPHEELYNVADNPADPRYNRRFELDPFRTQPGAPPAPPVEVTGSVQCNEPGCGTSYTRTVLVDREELGVTGQTTDEYAVQAAKRWAQIDEKWIQRDNWLGCALHPGFYVDDAARAHPENPLAHHLATGERSRQRLDGGSIGRVYRLTLNDGTTVIEKSVGDRFGADGSAQRQNDAEELASLTGQALGLRTPTVCRSAKPEVIYMEDLGGVPALEVSGAPYNTDLEDAYRATDDGRLGGLLDVLTDNWDRHPGNWLVSDSDEDRRIGWIDHGFVFEDATDSNVGRNLLMRMGDERTRPFSSMYVEQVTRSTRHETYPVGATWRAGNPIHPDDVAEIGKRLESVRDAYHERGREIWFNHLMSRWSQVSQHAGGDRRIAWDDPKERSTTTWNES